MKVIRLFSGSDKESHFEWVEVPLGELQWAQGLVFRRDRPGHTHSWHPAPRRQYVITLLGAAEIEIGSGERRTFGAGEVMLAEDTTGRGHITRVVGPEVRVSVAIPLSELRGITHE
ncbi:MAG: hypothetical protein AAGF11_37950 [Myxococcota bacterium]